MERYNEGIQESIEATREHFRGKSCSVIGYFQHLEKEMRKRKMHLPAEELHNALKDRIKKGNFLGEGR